MKNLNEMRKLAGLPLVESVETVEEAKPDFLDIDKDGDKEESMKKAANDAKKVDEADETLEESDIEESVRDATDRIYDMMDEGILDAETVVTACLKYMSEDEVADMAQANEFFYDEEDAYESAEDTISAASDRWLGEDDDLAEGGVGTLLKKAFLGTDKALRAGDKALATGAKTVAGAVKSADNAAGALSRRRAVSRAMRDPDAYRPSHRASNALSKAAVGGTAAAGLASALDKDKEGPQ